MFLFSQPVQAPHREGITKSYLNTHSSGQTHSFLFIDWFVNLILAYAIQELWVTLKHMLRH